MKNPHSGLDRLSEIGYPVRIADFWLPLLQERRQSQLWPRDFADLGATLVLGIRFEAGLRGVDAKTHPLLPAVAQAEKAFNRSDAYYREIVK